MPRNFYATHYGDETTIYSFPSLQARENYLRNYPSVVSSGSHQRHIRAAIKAGAVQVGITPKTWADVAAEYAALDHEITG